jgi:hypothetical protein
LNRCPHGQSLLFNQGKHLFGVLAGIDLRAGMGYSAVGADDVCDAPRVSGGRLITSPVSHAYRAICVAQQAEREIELLGKGAVLGFGVEAHAKDFDILCGELLGSITEPNTFDCSAGRVGFRVEPQDDRAAREIAQLNVFARVRPGREIRRGISNIEHTALRFFRD